jgi:uncharacterized protein YcbK (DUF882 family)
MKYFIREEFACKCGCGFDTVDYKLAEILDSLREFFGKPITITSGCRCSKHNENEEGRPKSQHLVGRAVDFKVKDVHPDDVANLLEERYPKKYGIGRYNGRTHFDTRDELARWDLRK